MNKKKNKIHSINEKLIEMTELRSKDQQMAFLYNPHPTKKKQQKEF